MADVRYKQRVKWMQSLQPGDVVCDCSWRHVRIKEISYVWYAWRRPIQYLLTFFPLLYDFLNGRKIPFLTYMENKDVITEDGSNCSIMDCCEDPNALDHYCEFTMIDEYT